MKTNATHICQSVEEALEKTREIKPDALGTKYHTFRIALSDGMENGNFIISALASNGWHLIGGPVLIEAVNGHPRHILISMLSSDPRPLEIRHRLKMHGEIRGEFQGDGEGSIRTDWI